MGNFTWDSCISRGKLECISRTRLTRTNSRCKIAYWHEYPIRWFSSYGDTSLIPQRLVWLPDTIIVPGSTEVGDQYFKPTDYYYADLEGNWNFYNTTIWGALHNTYNPSIEDEIGWTPQVYVAVFHQQY